VTRRTFLLDFSCLKKGVGNLFSKFPPTFLFIRRHLNVTCNTILVTFHVFFFATIYLFDDKHLFSILPNQQRARSDFRLILYMVNYGRVGKCIMRKSKRYAWMHSRET
jgi:hypothetical protein